MGTSHQIVNSTENSISLLVSFCASANLFTEKPHRKDLYISCEILFSIFSENKGQVQILLQINNVWPYKSTAIFHYSTHMLSMVGHSKYYRTPHESSLFFVSFWAWCRIQEVIKRCFMPYFRRWSSMSGLQAGRDVAWSRKAGINPDPVCEAQATCSYSSLGRSRA